MVTSPIVRYCENGRLSAENVSLKTMIAVAYGISAVRVAGPDWLDSDTFDLAGKAPEGVPDSEIMPMLQALLKDRFALLVHRELKEMAAYDLSAGKDGLKLEPFDPAHPPQSPRNTGGSVLFGRGPLSEVADALSRVLGRPVVDKTGITGRFAYALHYAPLPAQAGDGTADSGPPDVFAAVQQQMGLKLESKREPIEVVVVDHARRAPTEN